MQIRLGKDFFESRKGATIPVVMDTKKLINGHTLIVGSSGVGKSYTLRHMIRQGIATGKQVRIHVFDVHGDLAVPGASIVKFSETAPYGLNPLRVNADPDFGGVRKCIQTFLRTINQASSTALGVKQEAVLRNLLLDVYRDFGFDAEDPDTWGVNAFESQLVSGGRDNRLYLEVPFGDIEKAKALGARWEPSVKHWWVHTERYVGDITRWKPAYKERDYPTITDVLQYAQRLHVERFLGSDQKAVQALGQLNKAAKALQRKFLEQARQKNQGFSSEVVEEQLDAARVDAVDAYSKYVHAVRTGYELDGLMKYDSPEVLKSVADRLNNLKATGIFKSAAPPFDDSAPVWRYVLNALSMEEKKMMVLFLLLEIFNRATQRGEQQDVVEVVVLDELSTYTGSADEDGDGIIGIIARQARKFGLALWAADQSPAKVPESLISSVGTKIVLGLDEMYWNAAVVKLRMELKQLQWIQPTQTLAVQLKEKGALRSRWHWAQIET